MTTNIIRIRRGFRAQGNRAYSQLSVGESRGHMVGHMDYESAGHEDMLATACVCYGAYLPLILSI